MEKKNEVVKILVRLPKEVYEDLKFLAEGFGDSINSEIIHELKEVYPYRINYLMKKRRLRKFVLEKAGIPDQPAGERIPNQTIEEENEDDKPF